MVTLKNNLALTYRFIINMKYLYKILLVLLLPGCISYSKVYDSTGIDDNLVITGHLNNYIDKTSKLLINVNNSKCMSNVIRFDKFYNFSGSIYCDNAMTGTVTISMVNTFNGTGTIFINNEQFNFILK